MTLACLLWLAQSTIMFSVFLRSTKIHSQSIHKNLAYQTTILKTFTGLADKNELDILTPGGWYKAGTGMVKLSFQFEIKPIIYSFIFLKLEINISF